MKVNKELGASHKAESVLIHSLSKTTNALYDSIISLQEALKSVPKNADAAAMRYSDVVVPAMEALHTHADRLEQYTDKSCWPPTYSDLLFY